MTSPSDKTIERFSRYRRLVLREEAEGRTHIFSHEIAQLAHVTPAQVRRDLMGLKLSGSPSKGYSISQLTRELSDFLGISSAKQIALFGAGNLGRAILSYFVGRRPDLPIVAAFDVDPDIVGRVISGCRCHHMDDIDSVMQATPIDIAMITVPASRAQELIDRLLTIGVRVFVNFTPVPLKLPKDAWVENVDITQTLEKAAHFAERRKKR